MLSGANKSAVPVPWQGGHTGPDSFNTLKYTGTIDGLTTRYRCKLLTAVYSVKYNFGESINGDCDLLEISVEW